MCHLKAYQETETERDNADGNIGNSVHHLNPLQAFQDSLSISVIRGTMESMRSHSLATSRNRRE